MTANEIWEYVLGIEREYSVFRKRIMKKFSLSAAETDVLMFLANNPKFDTAAHISRIRKIPKSQVSLSVNALCQKGLLTGNYNSGNKKSVHLALTENAKPVIAYGHLVQEEFSKELFLGFGNSEKKEFLRLHLKIAKNIKARKDNEKCSI